ncbi:hypothetical protein Tco_0827805 [Tanacetum coccineum]
MVWRSTSLRYEMGEKKVNEVNFISQGVKLVSRILATMKKNQSEIQLKHQRKDELVVVVVKVVHELDYKMVVKELEGGLLEEMERSLDGGFVQVIDGCE